MKEKGISKAVISRLPRYYRYLGELLDSGIERISSGELSERMKVTASQIRQDLNNFGGFGQQGYGYNAYVLREEIGKILGLDKMHNMIIIGAGHLGQALANYQNFEKRGFIVRALFDVNPELVGLKIRNAEVHSMDELEEYIASHQVDIVTLTLPKERAAEVVPRLTASGIRAIWNFAHTDLQVGDDVLVENVHLSESLMQLSYRMLADKEEKQRKLEEQKAETNKTR